LAERFCKILNQWLSDEEIQEINDRNSTPEYEGLCASHDFCDPNQAMADALESLGLYFHPTLCEVINAAWDLSKSSNFQYRKELPEVE
jgi:hypothetical protein